MLYEPFFKDPIAQTTPISHVVDQVAAGLLKRHAATTITSTPLPRSNPWTHVGQAFEPTADAGEALKRSRLNWTVEKVGLRTDDLDPVPHQFAIRRTDTGKVLGVVGPEYHPLQNGDAFAFFRDLAGGDPISFETSGCFDGGSVVWVQTKLPDLQIRIGEDLSETYLFISNGHIGNKSLTIAPTTFRIACRNSLRMAEKQHAATRHRRPGVDVGWTVRHTRGMAGTLLDIRERLHPLTGELSPQCHIEQRPGFTTKTFENRTIPISGEARLLFLAHRPADYQPTDYVLRTERVAKKTPKQRKPTGPRTYRFDPVKAWIRVRDAARAQGAPFIEYMEMRHSFACACLQAGHTAEQVARWLGHASTDMVHKHYAHLLNYDEAPRFRLLTKGE